MSDYHEVKEFENRMRETYMSENSKISKETYEETLTLNEKSNPNAHHDAKICNYITTFITKNIQLLHLDLTQT